MIKYLVMGLSSIIMLACQPVIMNNEDLHINISENTDPRISLTNEVTPFSASTRFEAQVLSQKGLRFDISQYKFQPQPWNQLPAIPTQSIAATGIESSYLLPGEITLGWSWNHASIAIGRQSLDTPFIQTDNALHIPNFFESAKASFSIDGGLEIMAYHINQVSNWQFGDQRNNYISLGQSLEEQETDAASILTAQFTGSYLKSQAWFYHIPDLENISYFELSHFGNLSSDISYGFSGQVDWTRGTGASLLGNPESTTLGLRSDLHWSEYSLFIAFNKLISGHSTATGIGGDPYFTSLEILSFADFSSSNGYAVATGIGYEPESIPLIFEITAGHFNSGDQNNFFVREIDLSVGYAFSEEVDIRLNLSSVSGSGQENFDHRFAFSLNVPF